MPDHRRLIVTTASGGIDITGEDRSEIVLESGRARLEDDGAGDVVVRSASDSLVVRCPAGTDVRVGTESGEVRLRGRLGDAQVTTASAGIRVDHVDELEARSASGSIEVDRCVGRCRVHGRSRRASSLSRVI